MTDFAPGSAGSKASGPASPLTDSGLFPHFQAHPVSYLSVEMEDDFWAPRQQTARESSLLWTTEAHDEAGGLEALRRDPDGYVARTKVGELEHVKLIEAMASALGVEYDPSIAKLIDAWSDRLMDAQGADGYLAENYPLGWSRPKERWEVHRGSLSHEDYLIGHYIEAAIAYREATGHDEFFSSALRAADNMADAMLGSEREYASGHPEIEQALMRLYGATGNPRYLRLCGWLLDQRGHHEGRPSYGHHSQDHLPVVDQHTIEGHAVCAAYLFNGATEYVGATGDDKYRQAVLDVWEDLAERKMYLHGGSANLSSRDEGYLSEPYNIPPDDCYGESCAGIANFRWAHSLFSLTGEAKYLDTAERILYNAFPASISLAGNSTFYNNPAQTGAPAVAKGAVELTTTELREEARYPQLAVSCCPPNIVKQTNTVGGYFYSTDDRGVYVKHYGASTAKIPLGDGVVIKQRTDFPWSGDVALDVDVPSPRSFVIRLRIPDWAAEHGVRVNGEEVEAEIESGWILLEREWQGGDVIDLALAMPVERVTMPPRFKRYPNRVALRRGPIVYCLEEGDADLATFGEGIWMTPASGLTFVYIPESETFTPRHNPDFLGGVTVLEGEVRQIDLDDDERAVAAMFVPYCVWGNRTPSEMRIWLGDHREPSEVFYFQQSGSSLGDDV